MTMRNRGFTLIELMIVIAIIAVIAATLVPHFQQASRTSSGNQICVRIKGGEEPRQQDIEFLEKARIRPFGEVVADSVIPTGNPTEIFNSVKPAPTDQVGWNNTRVELRVCYKTPESYQEGVTQLARLVLLFEDENSYQLDSENKTITIIKALLPPGQGNLAAWQEVTDETLPFVYAWSPT